MELTKEKLEEIMTKLSDYLESEIVMTPEQEMILLFGQQKTYIFARKLIREALIEADGNLKNLDEKDVEELIYLNLIKLAEL